VSGEREVLNAYASDENGNINADGKHTTLVLAVSPNKPIASPIQYFRGSGNNWVDYKLTVINTATQNIWNKEVYRDFPLINQFDLTGKYTHKDVTMSYASFSPKKSMAKAPLLIWLHGGGEGGTDPLIPIIGNRAANYASEEIQSIFEGAYVLAPQCPGAWMHNKSGSSTHGEEDDIYNEGLMALIENYVNTHPGIDKNRIYLGGCSNGGYMTLKLILKHPSYFTAGFISSLAYQSEYITDDQIASIKNVPLWFVHSKDDKTTLAEKTVIPVYNRLKAAGASDLYFSFYDHVKDITGVYGGDNFSYNGHWSWVYLHANECRLDIDGKPVKVNNIPVNIMQWLSFQKK